jgi:hypothetical protein
MELKDFLKDYKFNFKEFNLGNKDYIIRTELIRRSDNKIISSIKNSIDIYETNIIINDSKTLFTFSELDWNIIIDKYKRIQIDQFAKVFKIKDFFPYNEDTDISNLDK